VKSQSRDGRWTLEVALRDGVELIRVCRFGHFQAEVRKINDLAKLGIDLTD